MNQTIYIIGTSHLYQHLSPKLEEDEHSKFQELIKSVVSDNDIHLIAEESNLEALKENKIEKSALQIIVNEIGGEHLFTEAELDDRNANNMELEIDIRTSGIMNGWTKDETEEKKQAVYRTRERYWLNKIRSKDMWPVLHVCGAKHADEFYKLVNNEGLDGVLLHEKWGHPSVFDVEG